MRGIGILVGISIGLIALAIPLDMLFRRLDIVSLPWLSEVIEYTMFTGVFMAAPWVLSENAHVRVDLILSALPPRGAIMLDLFTNSLGLAICLAFVWFATQGSFEAYEYEAIIRRSLNVPEWYLLIIFIISMVMMCLELIFRIASDLTRAKNLSQGLAQ